MLNIKKLKAQMVEKGMSVDDLSKELGIHPATMYRKLSRKDRGFTVSDAEKIGHALGLNSTTMMEVFFGQYVA